MIITPILDETEESQYEDHVRTTPTSPPPANDVQLQSNDTAQPNAADGDDAEDEATKTRTGRKRSIVWGHFKKKENKRGRQSGLRSLQQDTRRKKQPWDKAST